MELLLLYALEVRLIEHTPLFAMHLCFFPHLLNVELIVVLKVDLGLPHGLTTLRCHLDQLLRADHLVLVVEKPTAEVLLLLALEAEHVLGSLAGLLHFLDGELFLFSQDLDAVPELENILLLLEASPSCLLPARESSLGSRVPHTWIHRRVLLSLSTATIRWEMLHAGSRLRHRERLVRVVRCSLPCGCVLRSMFQLLRLWESGTLPTTRPPHLLIHI